MEVALRGGAFSEISDSNPVFTINSVLVTRARRLGNLRAEGRRDCDDVDIFGAVMDGHLFALTQVVLVSRELVGHLLNTEASPVESACLSVLGEDEVSGIESGCSSDARSFFSKLLHVERDSALALGCVVDLVDFVHGDHGIVHLEQVFVGDGSVIAFLDDVASASMIRKHFIFSNESLNSISVVNECSNIFGSVWSIAPKQRTGSI